MTRWLDHVPGLDRVPETVLRRLNSVVFWLVICYVGLVAVTVSLWGVNARTSREQSVRRATEQATSLANYRQCVGSIPQLQKLNTHLRGVNQLADTLAENSLANVASTPPNDPQLATRKANLDRLLTARAKIAAVKELPVPTIVECRHRAR